MNNLTIYNNIFLSIQTLLSIKGSKKDLFSKYDPILFSMNEQVKVVSCPMMPKVRLWTLGFKPRPFQMGVTSLKRPQDRHNIPVHARLNTHRVKLGSAITNSTAKTKQFLQTSNQPTIPALNMSSVLQRQH